MNKGHTIILTAFSLLLWAAPFNSASAETPILNYPINPDIEKILALPDDKIDVGVAALTFASEFYRAVDIAEYSKKIDAIAEEVRQRAGNTDDPDTRIHALNYAFFEFEKFHYDDDPNAMNKEANYFINRTLDTKEGICYTLPLLYIAIAQRLGYPIYPVLAPNHMFARYVSPGRTQDIEVTSGGKFTTDDHYINWLGIKKRGIESGSYMKTLSYHEYLASIMDTNALIYGHMSQGGKAVSYEEKASELNPADADIYHNLENGYAAGAEAMSFSPELAAKSRARAEENHRKAIDHGFVTDEEIDEARHRSGS